MYTPLIGKFLIQQLLVVSIFHYSRENNKQDKISLADFLENYYKKIRQTTKNVTLEKNRRGLILKIKA